MTGFKSFANKTVLNFEPGITGVVGPNGSGKSNVADAVRWALGEQSKSRLRLTDKEEVVFAGTAKRAKASFAEVVLLFDNEDGAFPLDLTEVEISRRLYRSGEADYRLGGRSVRLGDIQALLAQAGFGAGTYAVIGQGMIDSFLMSSPAERKLLFDEAAGIRGPELGREAALRKMAATSANLTRLRDIMAELTPRLDSLTRAVAAASEQEDLERQVGGLKAALVRARAAHGLAARLDLEGQLRHAGVTAHRLRHQLAVVARRLEGAQAQAAAAQQEREALQQALSALEHDRDRLGAKVNQAKTAVAEAERGAAEAQLLVGQLHDAQARLEMATQSQSEMQAQLASNAEAAERASRAVARTSQAVSAAQAELVALREDTSDGTRDQYVDHALHILKTLASDLNTGSASADQVRLLVHKAGRLLSHATRSGAGELLSAVRAAQKQLEAAMSKRETAVEHQTNVTITGRSLEIDLPHQTEAVERATSEVASVQARLSLAREAAGQRPGLDRQVEVAEAELVATARQLEAQRERVHGLGLVDHGLRLQIDLSTSHERIKAQAVAAEQVIAGLIQELTQAKAGLLATHGQARLWGVDLEASAPVTELTPDELEVQLLRAEARLEAGANARHDQAVEFDEVSTRHTELAAQIGDLETAQGDLERIITELDGLIRSRFRENFVALAEQFSQYFTRLFEGGSASLELDEAEDGRYGILIKASPKGKRLASIAALSGGERAMAGVALLAAILRVNPSPFVVLDEIDAALDEANSGRLASILHELQEHSQLIVITHNRQTMQIASVLFGVTINEHHVSHVLSMRLEEAATLAAR